MNVKTRTIKTINTMIRHANKGPSGFWTDDYEGCGNPKIFPEFEKGLRHGDLVQKKHYLCPWNTAVMYGNGHGNIMTGCYHSCSILDAKHLSTEMLKAVLIRFRNRLQDGKYDDTTDIEPLLTENERNYVKKQKAKAERLREEQRRKRKTLRIKKASRLLKKYEHDKYAQELISDHYGENIHVICEYGVIDFSPESMNDIVNPGKLTYDDYIDLQIRSAEKQRDWFKQCHYEMDADYKGKIERKTKDRICFERIYVCGWYEDGTGFEGKEDHVWMDIRGFEDFEPNDCVRFVADTYVYIKTGNGKYIDYGLHDPEDIEKIESYEVPTDEDLKLQAVDRIICETCLFADHCDGIFCLRNQDEKEALRSVLMAV